MSFFVCCSEIKIGSEIMNKKALVVLMLLSFSLVSAQTKAKFNYAAQKNFIPAELGKVYLGMPFNEFAKQFDLKNTEVGDTRFDWLSLTIPLEKGNVTSLTVRIHGLTQNDKKEILQRKKVKEKSETGFEFESEVDRLMVDKIPAKGFIYALYVEFKTEFDLKNYIIKTYGKNGQVRQANDEYHLFDIQWTKKTSDELLWLIRSFHEGKSKTLQLLGRIKGTEWGLDDL